MRLFKSLSFAFSFVILTTALHAQAFERPGYLADFDYQMTEVGTNGAGDIYHSLNTNTEMSSICANRAMLWSYEMDFQRMKGEAERLQSGKIFLFFTEQTLDISPDGTPWWYHVAPVVLSGGELKVLDGSFPNLIRGPVSIDQWNAAFAKGHKCTELKGTDTDILEEIRMGDFKLPSSKKGTCYYRVAPMYYMSPLSLVWHDIDNFKPRSAANELVNIETPFNPTGWLKSDLLASCVQGQDRSGFSLRSKEKWCEKFLHFGKWAKGVRIAN